MKRLIFLFDCSDENPFISEATPDIEGEVVGAKYVLDESNEGLVDEVESESMYEGHVYVIDCPEDKTDEVKSRMQDWSRECMYPITAIITI